MNERIIELTEISPKDFFGEHNSTIEQLKKYFPKIKIVARGPKLKIYGEAEILDEFETRLERLIKYFNRYNKLDENSIERILTSNGEETKTSSIENIKDVLIHGVNGKLIKPQTENQRKMVTLMAKNDMLFCCWSCRNLKNIYCCCFSSEGIERKRSKAYYINKTSC